MSWQRQWEFPNKEKGIGELKIATLTQASPTASNYYNVLTVASGAGYYYGVIVTVVDGFTGLYCGGYNSWARHTIDGGTTRGPAVRDFASGVTSQGCFQVGFDIDGSYLDSMEVNRYNLGGWHGIRYESSLVVDAETLSVGASYLYACVFYTEE